MAEPPKFCLNEEEFSNLFHEIRDLVLERTPDVGTALSSLIAITAGLAEAHIVANHRWSKEEVINMRDFFAVNIIRSHDLRIAKEGGDAGDVKHEDLFSPELLKRAGLMQ